MLSWKLIQQLFDYPLCLAKALSTKLSLRAVHCLCELWICRLYRLSSSLGRVERLLTPHSHPSIPLPPSFHPPVSCLLFAALWPCHLGDTPDHQGPGSSLGLAGDGPHHGNNGKRCWCGWGSGADGGLVVGIFFLCCGPFRRVKVWLHVVRPWHSKYIGMLLHYVARWPLIGLLHEKPWNHYEKEKVEQTLSYTDIE